MRVADRTGSAGTGMDPGKTVPTGTACDLEPPGKGRKHLRDSPLLNETSRRFTYRYHAKPLAAQAHSKEIPRLSRRNAVREWWGRGADGRCPIAMEQGTSRFNRTLLEIPRADGIAEAWMQAIVDTTPSLLHRDSPATRTGRLPSRKHQCRSSRRTGLWEGRAWS